MSFLDLFRSTPAAPAPTTAPAPAPVSNKSSGSIAVAEKPSGPTPEELEAQRKEQLRLEAERRIQQLRSSVAAEAMNIEVIPNHFTAAKATRDSGVIQTEIGEANAEKARLASRHQAAVQELLPIEAELSKALTNEHNGLSNKLHTEIYQLGLELIDAKLDEAYQRIDMSFMSKRKWSEKHGCALPLFAMFNIDNPRCILEGHAINARQVQQWAIAQPEVLSKLCPQVAKMLQDMALDGLPQWWSRAKTISASFVGGIPADIRAKISTAKPQFERIYIVTDSPDWNLESFEAQSQNGVHTRLHTPPIPQRDPLVIGEKNGKFWLVAAFDTTPAEEYVRREFTSDRKPAN